MNYTAIILDAQVKLLELQALKWDEALHPRAKDGRFGNKDSPAATATDAPTATLVKDQPKAIQREAEDFHALIQSEPEPKITAQIVLDKARSHPELVSLGLLFGAATILGLKPKLAQAMASKLVEVQKTKAVKRAERRLAKKAKDTQDVAEAGRKALKKFEETGETGLEGVEQAAAEEAAKVA